MVKVRVYPYKQGSKGAKALAEAMGAKVLKHEGSKFRPKREDVVINWGSTDERAFAKYDGCVVFNPPEFVSAASNKRKFFNSLKEIDAGVNIPDFWTARADIPADAYPVVCRTVLAGHSGEGIVIANNVDELVDAPLYTKYIKKKDEYRVHVVDGNAIFVQRKARKLDVEEPNWQIRNLANGFSFVEVDKADVPREVLTQAETTTDLLELDFGGVDVIWNEREQKAYVLEVNTACGLEERTANKYAEAFNEFIGRL